MISNIKDCTILNNGLKMPWLGFGVFQMNDGQEVENAVKRALEIGYRSIDTAAVYGNEIGVGKAIKASGISREEIFLTTKVWNDDQRKTRTLDAFQESLDRLQTDYVDLYLVHWPVNGFYKETWKAMEEIYKSGRTKSIGVSNFLVNHLEDILGDCKVVPGVNQIEFHPYLVQPELLKFCQKHKIRVEAWSPLMQGQIVDVPTIQNLAEKYNKTPAQSPYVGIYNTGWLLFQNRLNLPGLLRMQKYLILNFHRATWKYWMHWIRKSISVRIRLISIFKRILCNC